MFCTRRINNKIDLIHERALRLVYDDYTTSFSELLRKDNSISIHHRNIHCVAIEMYKVKMIYLHHLCLKYLSKIRYETRSGNIFSRPRVKTVKNGETSLQNFGPIVWNDMLPDNMKSCTSLDQFKNVIKTWVPENCPCRLCRDYIPGLGFATIVQ